MELEFKKDLLFRRLRDEILSGKYPDGYRFPPELKFSKELGVSFQTLRSAFGLLETSGMIARIPGKGTFVLPPGKQEPPKEKEKKLLFLFPDYKGNPNSVSYFNRELIVGVMKDAFLDSYVPELGSQKYHTDRLLERYRNGEFAGILWDRIEPANRDRARLLAENGVPQVLINREIPGIASVCCDYAGSLRQAGRFLRTIGHSRILLVDFIPARSVFMERLQALREAFLEDVKPNDCILSIPQAQGTWYEIAKTWKYTPDLTAMIVSNLHLASLKKFLEETRISVPRELSVIVWGENEELNRKTDSPFTILTEPRQLVGARAYEVLRKQIKGEIVSGNSLIEGELILRKGCSLPRIKNSQPETPAEANNKGKD